MEKRLTEEQAQICWQKMEEKGWTLDSREPLIEASRYLEPHKDWRDPKFSQHGIFADGVSHSTLSSFLNYERVLDKTYEAYCHILGVDFILGYVNRPSEENQCWQEIQKDAGLVRISATKETGKSKLVSWITHQAEKNGYDVAIINFDNFDNSYLKDYTIFLKEFSQEVTRSLKLKVKPWGQSIHDHTIEDFFENQILNQSDAPLILVLEQFDKVLESTAIATNFSRKLRYWNDSRPLEPHLGDLWRQLRLVIVHSTEEYPILDIYSSPLAGIGTTIRLEGIKETDDLTPLTRRLEQQTENPDQVLREIISWTNGQPFLTQKICNLIIDNREYINQNNIKNTVEKIIDEHLITDWKTNDHPAFFSVIEQRILVNPNFRKAIILYLRILHNEVLKQSDILEQFNDSLENSVLFLSGLIIEDPNKQLIVANKIYKSIFNEQWAREILKFGRPYQAEMETWIASGKKEDFLLRGKKLRKAQKWFDNIDKEEAEIIDYAFLVASKNLAERKQRWLVTFLIPLFLSLSITPLLILYIKPIVCALSLSTCRIKSSLFSEGEKTLYKGERNIAKYQGLSQYDKGNFSEARESFKKAKRATPNDPESWIYYNNALAQESNDFFTIAAIVPLGGRKDIAVEMLRGVAQAQSEYNKKAQDLSKPLMKVIVTDDENNQDTVQQVAKIVAKDPEIVFAVGHNTSTSTLTALPIYEEHKLPFISPTSTSTQLEGQFFFRTVPSDLVTGETLAHYARENKIDNVIVIYNPESAYSTSLTEVFSELFEAKGGNVKRKINLKTLIEAPIQETDQEIASALLVDLVDAIVLFPNIRVIEVSINLMKAHQEIVQNYPDIPNQLIFLGGDSLYMDDILQDGKTQVVGLRLAVPWFTEASPNLSYIQSSQEMWGGQVSWRTALSYDATKIFLKAIENMEEPSREKIVEALKESCLTTSESSGYDLCLDEHEPNRPSTMVQIVKPKSGPPRFELIENSSSSHSSKFEKPRM